jgi:hypothetical protein
MKTITSRTGLKNYLESVIKETLSQRANLKHQTLREEEKQSAVVPPETRGALKSGEVTAEVVIDKLNFIRSGRSFKDRQVKDNLEKYVNSLDKAEKTALLSFLNGIAQITTGEIPAEKALEPSDNPASVSMEKSNGKKINIKPTVIKPGGSNNKEDTTGPAPIQPKK